MTVGQHRHDAATVITKHPTTVTMHRHEKPANNKFF